MSDLISREQVIKGIKISWLGKSDVIQAENAILRYIERIPSAERKGKWLKVSYSITCKQCSACGQIQYLGEFMNFCPNCGADMRGEEDERSD